MFSFGTDTVRAFLTTFLAVLILACPLLCRATSDECCTDHEAKGSSSDEPHAPAPSSDGASCMCGGALEEAKLRSLNDPDRSISPVDALILLPASIKGILAKYQFAADGAPPSRNPGCGPFRMHALFNNYRC